MKLIVFATLAAFVALPAAADGVQITDPFARVIGPSGAAYFRIANDATTDDFLLSVTSPDAGMVMLMTDSADANGVMKMNAVPEGFIIKAKGARLLASAGDHVMLMGLTHAIKAGNTITLLLTFQHAGQVTVTLPVDNKRRTESGPGPTPNDATSAKIN